MKPRLLKQLCSGIFLALGSTHLGYAQTTLSAGDIAFTMIQSDSAAPLDGSFNPTGTSASKFTFVTLKTLSSGTTINFTDVGWGSGSFRANNTKHEGLFTFTATSSIAAGTQITISSTGNGSTIATASTGTIAETALPSGWTTGSSDCGFFLDSNSSGSTVGKGDQIIAFQGNITTPTFIAGFTTDLDDSGTYNTATGWGSSGQNNCGSALPTGLSAPNNSLSLSSSYNGSTYTAVTEVYSGYVTDLTGTRTKEQWQAYLNNPANWTKVAGSPSNLVLSISTIPEPSTSAIFTALIPLVGLVCSRKRYRR